MELSNEGIETVYYCPLAVNTDRLKRMFNDEYEVKNELYAGDISFIGSMYNENIIFMIDYVELMIIRKDIWTQ